MRAGNESYIRKLLFDRFLTLNEFSGVEFLKRDEKGNVLNVAKPNDRFVPPAKGECWFELHLLSGAPEDVGFGADSPNRWSGVLQIDIHAPLNRGQSQIDNIYSYVSEMFRKGTEISEVFINRVYKADETAEKDNYKTVIRVEWDADLC